MGVRASTKHSPLLHATGLVSTPLGPVVKVAPEPAKLLFFFTAEVAFFKKASLLMSPVKKCSKLSTYIRTYLDVS